LPIRLSLAEKPNRDVLSGPPEVGYSLPENIDPSTVIASGVSGFHNLRSFTR
jgi:hypothetical protein